MGKKEKKEGSPPLEVTTSVEMVCDLVSFYSRTAIHKACISAQAIYTDTRQQRTETQIASHSEL